MNASSTQIFGSILSRSDSYEFSFSDFQKKLFEDLITRSNRFSDLMNILSLPKFLRISSFHPASLEDAII